MKISTAGTFTNEEDKITIKWFEQFNKINMITCQTERRFSFIEFYDESL